MLKLWDISLSQISIPCLLCNSLLYCLLSTILTCCSVTFNNLAISLRSEDDKYFLFSNIFSSSNICRPVKVVRTFFFLFSCSSLSSIFRLIPHLRSEIYTPFKTLSSVSKIAMTNATCWMVDFCPLSSQLVRLGYVA